MYKVEGKKTDNGLECKLSGRVDSTNAPQVEEELNALIGGEEGQAVTVNMEDLEYISSAGLRVLLHLKKTCPDLKITDVNSEVYEILDMTGFTQIMTVEKGYRVVSVEGCEEIGRGANGTIYRIDQDNVVKVYNNADALKDIQHEREVARTALVLGVPTAISYDVVKVGDSYGSVFELLNARSFSKILADEPEKMDWCVNEFVKMLKIIHATLVPEGKLPDMYDTVYGWVTFMRDYLPQEASDKLIALIDAVPRDNHMIHGDYHIKNLELQGDEVLLIDMDTLAVGYPIFELGSMYNALIGFSEYDHENIKSFLGIDFETGKTFWHKTLAAYLGTVNEEKIREVEDKARIIGYTRMIRRSIRRKGLESERGKAEIELLKETDTLLFSRNELEIEAEVKNWDRVLAFINEHLEEANCPPKAEAQIALAAEEIFVNIANYAYRPEVGNATVRVEVMDNPVAVELTFMDQGKPYDPLKRDDPDITLPAEEREIGGLGIFLVKQTMDDVSYEYKDGRNILRLKKNLE